MFFLLRTAFWLTLVLVLIPIGSGNQSTSNESIDPVAAYFAAQATVSDLGGFCSRNPAACETGSEALSAIGARARDGARVVYEFLDTQIAERPENDLAAAPSTGDRELITGSTSAAGTLTPGDLALPWNGSTQPAFAPAHEIGPLPKPNPRAG
ncbi:DUF5330 domain-containing protein [Roseibium sp.]|uniref:DUF5330 domain-containing protein n=1 Tax=Roseibium sp. TaxID=1936156 RepID=UPI003A97330F